jgi:hypothetical protein
MESKAGGVSKLHVQMLCFRGKWKVKAAGVSKATARRAADMLVRKMESCAEYLPVPNFHL